MMSLLFYRAFLWFKKGANQWERSMLDYFGEGLMPEGFTFTRCQVAPATSVSCTSRSSRTFTHLPASAASLPTEQPWEGSSGPEGLRPFLTVIATDLWVPGNSIPCWLFLLEWVGGCVGLHLWLFLLGMNRIRKFKRAHNFKSTPLVSKFLGWKRKPLFLWKKDKGRGRCQRMTGNFLGSVEFKRTFWCLGVKVLFW